MCKTFITTFYCIAYKTSNLMVYFGTVNAGQKSICKVSYSNMFVVCKSLSLKLICLKVLHKTLPNSCHSYLYHFPLGKYTCKKFASHGNKTTKALPVGVLKDTDLRGAVASWLVSSTPDRAGRVQALAWNIVLCSWARHLTPTVPLSTHVYNWVLANLMLG